MADDPKPNTLTLLALRCWRNSPLPWMQFQDYARRSQAQWPPPPGFFRSLERRFRRFRKQLLGRKPASAPELVTNAVAPPKPRDDTGPATDFALYVSSLSNYFFKEMAELLAAGLSAAGWSCQLRTERDGAARAARTHVVFAPHEFFFLGEGRNCFDRSFQGRLLLLNTEQTHTQWFRLAARTFFLARHIFDMSEDSVRVLRARGYSTSHLRFGFVDGFGLYDGTLPLKLAPETEALGKAVREWRDVGEPLGARPLDVCFFGEATTRRGRILVELAPMLQGVESYLRLKPQGGEPWLAEATAPDHHTRLSSGIARRSKILLNLHRNDEPYFEWHRIVLMGLWHSTLVVTEPVTQSAPFVAGRDFVEAKASEMGRVMEYHLRDPRGIAEAERIREQGHRTLREACDFGQHLRETWERFL